MLKTIPYLALAVAAGVTALALSVRRPAVSVSGTPAVPQGAPETWFI